MSACGTDRDGFSVLRTHAPAREGNGNNRPNVSRAGRSRLIAYPIVTARRVGDQLVIDCPYCGRKHRHGAGARPGDGDGHRVAHCYQGDGYYVAEHRPSERSEDGGRW